MKKKHGKIVLLTKSKLNIIVVVISKALIDSNISHDKHFLINNVLKELYHMKKEIIQMINKSFNYMWNNVILSFKV